MFITKTQPIITVAAGEGTVATVQGPAATAKKWEMYNLDGANTLTYKWQYSDDNAIWTDVGVSATVSPGDYVYGTLTAHVFHRLRASGNLNIALKVDAEQDWAGFFSFMAI